MNANLIIVSLISWGVGIITTCIGVVLHSLLADRKLKKRICQVLYDELDSNRKHLEGAVVSYELWREHSLPYIFLLGSYMEARNCGIFRELPKKVRESIEGCYSFLQFLNSNRFDTFYKAPSTIETIDTFSKATSPIDTEAMNDLVKRMDETLPKLKEFCSNLRVYPHDDLAYLARKIKKTVLRRGYPQT